MTPKFKRTTASVSRVDEWTVLCLHNVIIIMSTCGPFGRNQGVRALAHWRVGGGVQLLLFESTSESAPCAPMFSRGLGIKYTSSSGRFADFKQEFVPCLFPCHRCGLRFVSYFRFRSSLVCAVSKEFILLFHKLPGIPQVAAVSQYPAHGILPKIHLLSSSTGCLWPLNHCGCHPHH